MKVEKTAGWMLLGLTGVVWSGVAFAGSWPVARHDAARTGASSGVVPTTQPTITWRAYMGGRPGDASARFGLSDASIVVAFAGGRVIAKDVLTQATHWKSDLLGNGSIADVADLDGDGKAEIIVATETRAFVLDAQTGAAVWGSPPADFHAVASVRVVDLDGDGLRDVYIDECESCANVGTKTAAGYSFAAGLEGASELWSRPIYAVGGGLHSGADSIVDLDGDGVPEIALASYDEMLLLRGNDGSVFATLTDPTNAGKPFPGAFAMGAELDGTPGLELLVVQTNGTVATQSGPPALSAYEVDPATGVTSHRWTASVGAFDGELVAVADVSTDLDGDGVDEVVFSSTSQSGGGVWTTSILAGATGQIVATIAGARFEGAADLDGIAGDEIVVTTTAGLELHAMTNGALAKRAGPLAGLRALGSTDTALRGHGPVQRRLATLAHPGARTVLLAGHPTDPLAASDQRASFSTLDVVAIELTSAGAWITGPSFTPSQGEVTGLVRADDATRPYPQIAVGSSAGTLAVLDWNMKSTNGAVWLGGAPTGTVLGGARQPSTGAYGGPLIAEDALGPFVVLPGAPGGLLTGDARTASWIVPPATRWLSQTMTAASVLDLGPLGTAVVGAEGFHLVARETTSGAPIAAIALGQGQPWGTALPLTIAGKEAPLVGIDWRIEGVQIVQIAADIASGAIAYAGAPLPYGGFFGSGVGDLDGDGTDSWFSMNGPLNVRDAATGQITTYPAVSTTYGLPMAAQFTGDASPDLLLQAGVTAPMLIDDQLAQIWQAPATESVSGMGGARAVCAGGPVFVSPAVRSPFIRAFAGATGALLAEKVLAGGKVYASVAAAQAAGATPGLLSNASAVADMGGSGPTVLAGSSDGYLYAISACTLDLVFSKSLGSPVAEPIVGDLDGDGLDEIVVGAADGYVYGLDLPAIDAPLQVALGAQSIAVGAPLTASWSAVPGASGYELALVGPDDTAVWSPPYRLEAGTSAQIALDGALAGRPYRVAVRAVSAAGKSPDALSGAAVIDDHTPPVATLEARSEAAGAASIDLAASDDLALDSFVFSHRLAADEALTPSDDGLLIGKDAARTLAWTVPAELFGQYVVLALDVLDSGGNAAHVEVPASISADGVVSFGEAPPGPTTPAQPARTEASEIGGCAASPGRSAPLWPAVVALGAWLVSRRRARRDRLS